MFIVAATFGVFAMVFVMLFAMFDGEFDEEDVGIAVVTVGAEPHAIKPRLHIAQTSPSNRRLPIVIPPASHRRASDALKKLTSRLTPRMLAQPRQQLIALRRIRRKV